jgi:uncharacterized membrane protein (UPF0127 family)
LAAALAVLLVAGGGGAGAQHLVDFPRSRLEIVTATGKHHSFDVELAQTPQQLSQGLMFRQGMAANAGMLFDFGHPRPVSMWMKNTLIPLDMLFLDEHGNVAGIAARAVPGSEAVIRSPGPVKAVLELNGGTAARFGLKPGDRVAHAWFGKQD